MSSHVNALQLRKQELADATVARLHLECLAAEKRFRGASKLATAAAFEITDNHLKLLLARIGALDEQLMIELQQAVKDWHDSAVAMHEKQIRSLDTLARE